MRTTDWVVSHNFCRIGIDHNVDNESLKIKYELEKIIIQ